MGLYFRAFTERKPGWIKAMPHSPMLLAGLFPKGMMARVVARCVLEKSGGRHGFSTALAMSLSNAEVRAALIIHYPVSNKFIILNIKCLMFPWLQGLLESINGGDDVRAHISDEDDSQISVVLGYRLTVGPEKALLRIHPEFHGPAWYREARRQLWLKDTRAFMSLSYVHKCGVKVGEDWYIQVAIRRLTRSRDEYCQVLGVNWRGELLLRWLCFIFQLERWEVLANSGWIPSWNWAF